MGTDLTLLPFDGDDFSHTVLPTDRDLYLMDAIKNLPHYPVPEGFKSHMARDIEADIDLHYGPTPRTLYDTPLMCATAGDLKKLSPSLDNWKNRAAWAYLGCLPDDTLVALYYD